MNKQNNTIGGMPGVRREKGAEGKTMNKLKELEIAISVEITKINAMDHEGSIASEMSALARVDALEWVLGLIKKPDRKDKDD